MSFPNDDKWPRTICHHQVGCSCHQEGFYQYSVQMYAQILYLLLGYMFQISASWSWSLGHGRRPAARESLDLWIKAFIFVRSSLNNEEHGNLTDSHASRIDSKIHSEVKIIGKAEAEVAFQRLVHSLMSKITSWKCCFNSGQPSAPPHTPAVKPLDGEGRQKPTGSLY